VFTAIPGVGFPAHPPQVIRLDFGPGAVSGVATTLPPVEGKPYPHFDPSVDRDGNEVSGIRLPDLTVPLATYTGWNLRHPQMGAPGRLMSLMGSTIPFPATPEERAKRGDPRRSIAERYPSRARYLEQVRQEAQRLIDEGYLLAEDLELVVDKESRRYGLLAVAREPVAAGE
jgi:Alpha/beta hydrolase domain